MVIDVGVGVGVAVDIGVGVAVDVGVGVAVNVGVGVGGSSLENPPVVPIAVTVIISIRHIAIITTRIIFIAYHLPLLV